MAPEQDHNQSSAFITAIFLFFLNLDSLLAVRKKCVRDVPIEKQNNNWL